MPPNMFCATSHSQFDRYNPILGVFSNPDRESDLSEKAKCDAVRISTLHGMSVNHEAPIRLTSCYDLLSNSSNDPTLSRANALAWSRRRRAASRNEQEVQARSRSEKDRNLMERRSLSRVSYERFSRELHRGFDIINNCNFVSQQGEPAYKPPSPRCEPPPTHWETIKLATG